MKTLLVYVFNCRVRECVSACVGKENYANFPQQSKEGEDTTYIDNTEKRKKES